MLISLLREKLRLSEPAAAEAVIASGCQPLDQLLPGRGFARGTLVEWLAETANGAACLTLRAAHQACREGGWFVVVDRERNFYPPAAAAWQIDLSTTMVIRPTHEQDEYWALDQALRCPHVAAVVGWPRQLDHLTFRRLQLAAEASGTLGLFVRPASARREPSWADVRLGVSARTSRGGWRLQVELLRCRRHFGQGVVELEIDDWTGEIREPRAGHLAAPVAGTARDPHQARA